MNTDRQTMTDLVQKARIGNSDASEVLALALTHLLNSMDPDFPLGSPRRHEEGGRSILRWFGPHGDEGTRFAWGKGERVQFAFFNFDTEKWNWTEYVNIDDLISTLILIPIMKRPGMRSKMRRAFAS